ncbi:hypothetical protein SK854_36360 [Lentzea sp. BCCO 10_0061]|uniref:Uncharacterized protein n=1 Tax=Lentzea sokolovensis TaxID=3095429 RepID=A0ABU4V8F3_9PSEU|nr:hypothetical protein [Lentzea sp. BCCO 10_0061]MDX8147632.1 hypothetical protein [Lentzea sp. BCCO 10_0061]
MITGKQLCAEVDAGDRPGTTSGEVERIAQLERENRELRRANQMLKRRGFGLGRQSFPGLARWRASERSEAMRKSFRRSLAAVSLAAAVSTAGVVAAPAAQAHDGWAVCKYLTNGHLCARGVDGGRSTDILYHKTGGEKEITARFYLIWSVTGEKVYDNGSFKLRRGVASFVFSGARFVNYRRCMEVQGQGSFCV